MFKNALVVCLTETYGTGRRPVRCNFLITKLINRNVHQCAEITMGLIFQRLQLLFTCYGYTTG